VKRTSIALVLLALSGAASEQAKAHEDRTRFPQIGRSIDIGGRSLNIFGSGQGNPTVVLLSGGGLPSGGARADRSSGRSAGRLKCRRRRSTMRVCSISASNRSPAATARAVEHVDPKRPRISSAHKMCLELTG
jgi:hypothetical protein